MVCEVSSHYGAFVLTALFTSHVSFSVYLFPLLLCFPSLSQVEISHPVLLLSRSRIVSVQTSVLTRPLDADLQVDGLGFVCMNVGMRVRRYAWMAGKLEGAGAMQEHV